MTIPSGSVLDPCCGTKMFWFNKNDPRAIFGDRRSFRALDPTGRMVNVDPDIVMDFTRLPFAGGMFSLVVFDPPHVLRKRVGAGSRFDMLYGTLPDDWAPIIKAGFAECMRVLRPGGTLIFKWSDRSISRRSLLTCIGEEPLFGERTGRRGHWMVFIKRMEIDA